MFPGGDISICVFPLLFLLLLTAPLLHFLPLLALDRAISRVPFLLLWHSQCLHSTLPLLLWLGRPCGISMYPRHLGLSRRIWRPWFQLAGRCRWLPVSLSLWRRSAVPVLAVAIVFFGLLGEAGDAGVESRSHGVRAAGGAFAVGGLEQRLLAAFWLGDTGVFQRGVLPCVFLIGDEFWLLGCWAGTVLLFALIHGFCESFERSPSISQRRAQQCQNRRSITQQRKQNKPI